LHENAHLIEFLHLPKGLTEAALVETITAYVKDYEAQLVRLVYNFISAQELLHLNQRHLEHNYETDILTFDYGTPTCLEAEVYISLQALEEAPQRFSQTLENEAVRLIGHGLFHCLGQKDKSDQEKKEMRLLEDNFIERFHVKQQDYV